MKAMPTFPVSIIMFFSHFLYIYLSPFHLILAAGKDFLSTTSGLITVTLITIIIVMIAITSIVLSVMIVIRKKKSKQDCKYIVLVHTLYALLIANIF